MDVTTFTAHRRSLTTPGGEIAYTDIGAGPAALFVHGLATSGPLSFGFEDPSAGSIVPGRSSG